MNEAQATPIRDALRDVQEMWDELHRRGLNPQIMRRYSDAISVLERDFTGRLAAGVSALPTPKLCLGCAQYHGRNDCPVGWLAPAETYGVPASEYLAKIKADPRRAAALQRARGRAAGVAMDQPAGWHVSFDGGLTWEYHADDPWGRLGERVAIVRPLIYGDGADWRTAGVTPPTNEQDANRG